MMMDIAERQPINEWRNPHYQDKLWKEGKYNYQKNDVGTLLKYDIIRRFISDLGPLRVLDVGAGHALFDKLFHPQEYFYCDISESATLLAGYSEPIDFNTYDFGDRKFNLILFLGMLPEFYEFKKMKKVFDNNLEKGGMIIVEHTSKEKVDIWVRAIHKITYSYNDFQNIHNRTLRVFRK